MSSIDNVNEKGYCVLYAFLGVLLFIAMVYGIYQGNWNGLE